MIDYSKNYCKWNEIIKPDEEVYIVFHNFIQNDTPCEICNGTGFIDIKNESFQCPKCLGKGQITSTEICKWDISNENIDQVMIQEGSEYETYNVSYYIDGIIYGKRDVFRNKEEALAEAERRNKCLKNSQF